RALDRAGVEIDDPVLGDAFLTEQVPFLHAVGSGGAWRKNLYGKRQSIDLFWTPTLDGRCDENIGLDSASRRKNHVGRSHEGVAERLRGHVRCDEKVELTHCRLVRPPSSRRTPNNSTGAIQNRWSLRRRRRPRGFGSSWRVLA